jgi:hypothetical protein
VRERLNYAASYNRQNGNSVIRLDWSPANRTASPWRFPFAR